MSTSIGDEGQIIIEREIRHKLGVSAGWQARQVIAGDHLEIYFDAPQEQRAANGSPTRKSMRGAAKPFIRRYAPQSDWDVAVADSITQDF